MLNNIAEKVKEMNYVSDCVSRLEDKFEKFRDKFQNEILDTKFRTYDIDGISRDINSLSDEVYMANQNIGDLYQTVENVVQETKGLSQAVGTNYQMINDLCEKEKYKEE